MEHRCKVRITLHNLHIHHRTLSIHRLLNAIYFFRIIKQFSFHLTNFHGNLCRVFSLGWTSRFSMCDSRLTRRDDGKMAKCVNTCRNNFCIFTIDSWIELTNFLSMVVNTTQKTRKRIAKLLPCTTITHYFLFFSLTKWHTNYHWGRCAVESLFLCAHLIRHTQRENGIEPLFIIVENWNSTKQKAQQKQVIRCEKKLKWNW